MYRRIGKHFQKAIRVSSLIMTDIIVVNIAGLLALYIHYEGVFPPEIMANFAKVFLVVTIMKILIFNGFKLYDSLWEYASVEELIKVVFAVIVANIASVTYMKYMSFNFYAGVYIIILLLEVAFVGGVRFSYRFVRRVKHHGHQFISKNDKNVLIVGSGSTARLVATEIKNHPKQHGHVVGYIDDNERIQGKAIAGVRILGGRYEIYSICKKNDVDEIIIAAPTLSKDDRKEIINECQRTNLKVKILPGIIEIMDGQVSMNQIRDVEIEDLLGRDPIDLNLSEIASYIEEKTILVTGGGGSIGSELCRQIAKYNPKELLILDIYENNAYDIQNELIRTYGDQLKLDTIIASVRDKKNITRIIKEHGVDVIFHAAAHKHVPLMERSPKEAIKNNVFGTLNVAQAAHEAGVERFVMISTDKAVNPTNVMGASKRMCEMIMQSIAKQSKTKFVGVRFGNVLGSNGSVIPLFKRQIKEGGPLTVTHKEIIRYFMTIPEASQLVIQAGAIAKGGEIFVLDMGEPVKIYKLAEDLIKLSGLKPHEDIEIEVTGLRPGEKLYEELLMKEEGLVDTKYEKIFVGSPSEMDYSVLLKSFDELRNIINNGSEAELIDMISHIVPTYQSNHVVNRNGGHGVESIERYRVSEV